MVSTYKDVTDIESVGAEHVLAIAPATLVVFMIPPAFDEWMKRLTNRGQLDQEELQRRLASAEVELEDAIESDSFTILVNDDSKQTARDIQNLAFAGTANQDTKKANDTAWKLLNELKQAVHS